MAESTSMQEYREDQLPETEKETLEIPYTQANPKFVCPNCGSSSYGRARAEKEI